MARNSDDAFKTAYDRAESYRARVTEAAPWPETSMAALRSRLGGPVPETGSAGDAVIADLADAAEPGLLAMTGPRMFGWVVGASHPVGMAADWLTTVWGQNAGNFHATPAAAIAEEVVRGWLLDLLDLPRESSVGFVTGATMANFVGLAAARSEVLRRAGWDLEENGLAGAPEIHVFIGDDAHTTVFSGLRFLGLGLKRAIRIPTDDQGRMSADTLAREMDDRPGPKIVIGQAGQINTGAFDPFEDIVQLCRQHDAWLHVDGAFGLWARACPDLKSMTTGIEGADSWATDGHKWLQVPYDSGFVFVRDAEAHRRAMTSAASYLPAAAEDERDPTHYVPELSRRARGFAAWAVIKALGRQGIVDMVIRHCQLARRLADQLRGMNGIEILNHVTLNQIAIGFGAGASKEVRDACTEQVLAILRKENRFVVGGALWKDRWIMRVSIISWPTRESDIDALGDAIGRAWGRVRRELPAKSAA